MPAANARSDKDHPETIALTRYCIKYYQHINTPTVEDWVHTILILETGSNINVSGVVVRWYLHVPG